MLFIAGLRRDNTPQFQNRAHSVVFTANAALAKQAFSEFKTDLKETITLATESSV